MAYFLIGICLLNFVVNFGPLIYKLLKKPIAYCRIKKARNEKIKHAK